MDCRDVVPLLSRRADGELGPGRGREVDSHLAGCASCRESAELHRREAALIAAALQGGLRTRGRGRFRTLAVAAVLLPLVFVGLTGLLRVYESAIETVHAAKERQAADAWLDREVLVRSGGMPLSYFVALLAEKADVEIRLADGALERLGEDPPVHIDLVEPLRLRFVLGLLELFYGLRTSAEDGAIRLD